MTPAGRKVRYGIAFPEKAALFLLLLFLTAGMNLAAESRTAVKITSLGVLSSGPDDELLFAGYGAGRLSLQSSGSRDVKGLFAMDSLAGSTSLLSIYRAWIQVDFPAVRLTTGKARLSWGEGIYFNAGDVLYGSTDLSASLTDSVFRDQARLLQAAYIPLGIYSYAEALVMPPEYNVLGALLSSLSETPDPHAAGDFRLSQSDAGFRLVSRILDITTEAGYLYSGSGNIHKPYVSLQGHLLADWYLSASTSMGSSAPGEDLLDNLTVSAGLFTMHSFPSDAVLTFRLEALASPGGKWEAESSLVTAGPPALYQDPGYGLFLYPEISFAPVSSLSFTLNGLYSPVDNSGQVSLASGWGVYQGLRLLGSLTLKAGEREDLFGFDRTGGFSLSLGAEYLF